VTTVASFSIDYVQYLSPEGQLVGDKVPAFAKDFAQLKKLYELMVLTRVFDAKAIALQRTGKLGTYASSLGHEAVHVGMGAAMKYEDVFAPMYREYGTQFHRGVKMSEVLLYWGGDERGSNFSGPKHDFPWCVPIATQNLHAAGAALAFKLRGEERAAVTVIGDGGSSKGDFLEAINAAGAFKLPLVLTATTSLPCNRSWTKPCNGHAPAAVPQSSKPSPIASAITPLPMTPAVIAPMKKWKTRAALSPFRACASTS